MSTKVTYIISDVDKAVSFEWLSEAIKLKELKFSFILISQKPSHLHKYLKEAQINSKEFIYTSRLSIFLIFTRILFFFVFNRPDVVHTHLHMANILGLSAAWMIRIRKRMFTRHHAMIHYQEYPSGLKWDKWCNAIATDVIAISKNVKDILLRKDGVKVHKVHLIHHGFKLDQFHNVSASRVKKLADKYELQSANPVIGVIARYVEWKGIQFIIPAFQELLSQYPNAKLVLANASGPYQNEISALLSQIPNDRYIEIEFEMDVPSLYQLFDVYVHTPIDENVEAFGQTYIEALAAGIPSIFTLSGVGKEILVDQSNCLAVNFKSSKEIHSSLLKLLENNSLKLKLSNEGKKTSEEFNFDKHVQSIDKLYY